MAAGVDGGVLTPLLVTAELVHGYVSRDPWSPALDGIVAAVVMRDRLGAEAFAIGGAGVVAPAPVEGLPFTTERDGDLWWYCASSPMPVGDAGTELRPFHRRFDDQHERFLAPGVRRVMTAAGPLKGTRLHAPRRICRALAWHAIGDAAQLRALLARVDQVGGRRGAGSGVVSSWRVELGGDEALARRHRPLPVGYAARHQVEGPVVLRGLVPPTRWNLVECVMPDVA